MYHRQFESIDPNILAIATHKCEDETAAVEALIEKARLPRTAITAIQSRAKEIVNAMRSKKNDEDGVSAMLSQYGLSTEEGTALMCLAEAMLRVPDAATVDQLIEDKIATLDWKQHTGRSHSLFVNAATWGLVLTGKVMDRTPNESQLVGAMHSVVSRLGAPVVRQAVKQSMQIFGQQFVMGRSIKEAIKKSRPNEKKNYLYSYDMLGEAARTDEDAAIYMTAYEGAIAALSDPNSSDDLMKRPGVSIKLSALYPRYEFANRESAQTILTERFLKLVQQAKAGRVTITMDAEEADRLEMSLVIFQNVFNHPSLNGWSGLGLAVQSYQKRGIYVVDWLIRLARAANKRMMVRLIKGAYWDSEIKHAQEMGYDGYPVFTRKPSTDISYLACARDLIAASDCIYPQFATHNAMTVASILHCVEKGQSFEFQCLHGMGRHMYDDLLADNQGAYPCRIYAPVGGYQDLLPYLVRRLLENGANSSFVNRIVDPSVPLDEIVADPVAVVEGFVSKPHPDIALPSDLFQGRKNSRGVDLTDPATLQKLASKMDAAVLTQHPLGPLLDDTINFEDRAQTDIRNPAQQKDILAPLYETTEHDLEQALQTAEQAALSWDATPVEVRADYLLRAADLLEERIADFMVMAIREAGKTWPDAVAEVREAVDFLRYYAMMAQKTLAPMPMPGPTGEKNILYTHGRGVMLCISPWNFPLAIFVGQMSAALVAGNTVIAKPATQTMLIATHMVRLFREVGLPTEVLQLLPGGARTVGIPLVADPRVQGVMLTGSTHTGKAIAQALAQRPGAIATLVAETGGQNAMIVDSTALPEQVVADVIESAFKSAGQRCSAARILFIQEEVADKIIEMLKGAMALLTIGDPKSLSTDVGPVIDAPSCQRLVDHTAYLDSVGATCLYRCQLDSELADGTFFAPCAYEIESLDQLKEEVFGPVLHIIRYKRQALDQVMAQINATGFGLTLGIQSRIDRTVDDIVRQARVGNIYINRNMIGAMVGVQPFGGQGLSGTGPKAGGPHYLSRLVVERTVTNNIAAVGGNTSLLTLAQDRTLDDAAKDDLPDSKSTK